MAIKTLYTAVGRFERRTNGCNRSCPIILLGGQEYMADMQEMVIWSMLNWRILRWDDIAQEWNKTCSCYGVAGKALYAMLKEQFYFRII